MNKKLKTFVIAILVMLTGLLGACSKSPAPVVNMVPTPTAEQQWLEARDAIRAIGTAAAQTGKFRKAENCEVVTSQLTQSPSYKKFPVLGLETYKGACKYEVAKVTKPKTAVAKASTGNRAVVKRAKPTAKSGAKVANR